MPKPIVITRQNKIAYNAREAAAATGQSQSSILRDHAEGRLRRVPHLGRRLLFAHGELERVYGDRAMLQAVDS